MKKLLTMTTAAAGLAVLMADPAMAIPLNTTITLTVWHGPANGLGTGSARQSEQALPSAASVLTNLGSVTYTGGINFGLPSTGTDTIGAFLTSGGVTPPAGSAGVTLSTGNFTDASLFRFSFTLATAGVANIAHDDGVSVFAAGTTTNPKLDASAPTSLTSNTVTLAAGSYDLWYSEVNALPANLTFDFAPAATVPEPVSMALLGTGLPGLGLARRKVGRA